mgnify:CR=1 FL=1
MFLIAGISPKMKTLETTPRICPSCGLAQAYLKRVDHYLSLFFIPVLRVKKGEPVLVCNRCRAAGSDRPAAGRPVKTPEPGSMCKQCGRTLDNTFTFCPYCGAKNR